MFITIKNFFVTIFTILLNPDCWMRDSTIPYSKEWDEMLNRLLDDPIFEHNRECTVCLNGVCIWKSLFMGPHPYHTFMSSSIEWKVYPKRVTAVRFRKELNKYLDSGVTNKFNEESLATLNKIVEEYSGSVAPTG